MPTKRRCTRRLLSSFRYCAALGLRYFTIRFVDVGNGIKNVMELTPAEIATLRSLQVDYDFRVASVGSPIGKIKLRDVQDGTDNRYVPFDKYLDQVRSCNSAQRTNLTHVCCEGFHFTHRWRGAELHLAEATQRIGRIADLCQAAGVIFGLEVEANLVGRTGRLLANIHGQVNSPSLKLIFDAANLLYAGIYRRTDGY